MTRRLFDFSSPDRFVADAIGEPGRRAFYLQARQGGALVTVLLEKVQLAALAGRLADLLDAVATSTDGALEAPPSSRRDDAPLESPVAEAFRVGALALAWDGATDRVVIEAAPAVAVDEDGPLESEETADHDLLRVSIDPSRARDFIRRAAGLVASGRPTCPFCGQPLGAGGHFCPRVSLN